MIGGGIVVLILGIGGGYYFFMREKVPVVVENTTPPPVPIFRDVGEMLREREELLKVSNDTDGDGLTNADEQRLGTNPQRIDSDNDGLTDKFEIETLKTNPLKADTDGNGISDWNEDYGESSPSNETE